ncbi:MAG: hypothetical protein J0I75_11815, partial [Hyphomicrobium sp.]|nr:hypothetical protein [Hyphomicrobium sp.]
SDHYHGTNGQSRLPLLAFHGVIAALKIHSIHFPQGRLPLETGLVYSSAIAFNWRLIGRHAVQCNHYQLLSVDA